MCYETAYTDADFTQDGYVAGGCPAEFDALLSVDNEVICDGHSTENVKYCPTTQRTITISKKGVDTAKKKKPNLRGNMMAATATAAPTSLIA